MKYLVIFFLVTFLMLASTYAYAEQKIVYIDMKIVLNQSKAGKEAQDFLQKSFKTNQKKFADLEDALKKEEKDLLAKKTILSKEDYQKKADGLRKKVIDYQSDRRSSLDKIAVQRANARKKLLEKIDPLLNAFLKENNISMVVDKKSIYGGSVDLDITKKIIEKLNKELPSLNLK